MPRRRSPEAGKTARLEVVCSTFNVSKQGAPEVVSGKAKAYWDAESEAGSSVFSDHHEVKAEMQLKKLYRWVQPDAADVYFFALQECRSKHFPEWQQFLLKLVSRGFDPAPSLREIASKKVPAPSTGYSVLSSVSMWGIHGILIVRTPLVRHFSHVHTDWRACGLGGVMGNKGAVGIAFQYGDGSSASSTSFAFVNAHLAARAERLPQRQQNYAEICRGLLRNRKRGTRGLQLLHAHDHVFWAGDLNYRVDMGSHGSPAEFSRACGLAADGELRRLAEHDQLGRERAMHNVLVGFREGALQFPPTYRLDFGRRGVYGNKRNQNPSWTDRVLWRSLPGSVALVDQTSYYAAEDMVFSDHRPVTAAFSVLTLCEAAPATVKPAATVVRRRTFREKKKTSVVWSTAERRRATLNRALKSAAAAFGVMTEAPPPQPPPQPPPAGAPLGAPNDGSEEPPVTAAAQFTITVKNLEFVCRLADDEEATEVEDDAGDDDARRRRQGQERWSGEFSASSSSDSEDGEGDAAAAAARLRSNSYQRPATPLATSFVGQGFSQGHGTLEEHAAHCSPGSSEFDRYVSHGNCGVHSTMKLGVKFHSKVLEKVETPPEWVSGAASGPGGAARYYKWADAHLPVYEMDTLAALSSHHMTIMLHGGSSRRLVGQAHVALADMVDAKAAWFAVPVLLDGLPAGVLRGELKAADRSL